MSKKGKIVMVLAFVVVIYLVLAGDDEAVEVDIEAED